MRHVQAAAFATRFAIRAWSRFTVALAVVAKRNGRNA